MKKKSMSFLVAGISFSLLLAACGPLLVGGAGAGAAYLYTSGWLERDYSATLDQAYNGSMQALQDLGATIEEKEKQVAEANIKASMGDQSYWVKIENKGENLVKISVRAGVIGDEEASKKIHRAIESQLG